MSHTHRFSSATLWASRDRFGDYWITKERPSVEWFYPGWWFSQKQARLRWPSGAHIGEFCAEGFEELVGESWPRGEQRKLDVVVR